MLLLADAQSSGAGLCVHVDEFSVRLGLFFILDILEHEFRRLVFFLVRAGIDFQPGQREALRADEKQFIGKQALLPGLDLESGQRHPPSFLIGHFKAWSAAAHRIPRQAPAELAGQFQPIPRERERQAFRLVGQVELERRTDEREMPLVKTIYGLDFHCRFAAEGFPYSLLDVLVEFDEAGGTTGGKSAKPRKRAMPDDVLQGDAQGPGIRAVLAERAGEFDDDRFPGLEQTTLVVVAHQFDERQRGEVRIDFLVRRLDLPAEIPGRRQVSRGKYAHHHHGGNKDVLSFQGALLKIAMCGKRFGQTGSREFGTASFMRSQERQA